MRGTRATVDADPEWFPAAPHKYTAATHGKRKRRGGSTRPTSASSDGDEALPTSAPPEEDAARPTSAPSDAERARNALAAYKKTIDVLEETHNTNKTSAATARNETQQADAKRVEAEVEMRTVYDHMQRTKDATAVVQLTTLENAAKYDQSQMHCGLLEEALFRISSSNLQMEQRAVSDTNKLRSVCCCVCNFTDNPVPDGSWEPVVTTCQGQLKHGICEDCLGGQITCFSNDIHYNGGALRLCQAPIGGGEICNAQLDMAKLGQTTEHRVTAALYQERGFNQESALQAEEIRILQKCNTRLAQTVADAQAAETANGKLSRATLRSEIEEKSALVSPCCSRALDGNFEESGVIRCPHASLGCDKRFCVWCLKVLDSDESARAHVKYECMRNPTRFCAGGSDETAPDGGSVATHSDRLKKLSMDALQSQQMVQISEHIDIPLAG